MFASQIGRADNEDCITVPWPVWFFHRPEMNAGASRCRVRFSESSRDIIINTYSVTYIPLLFSRDFFLFNRNVFKTLNMFSHIFRRLYYTQKRNSYIFFVVGRLYLFMIIVRHKIPSVTRYRYLTCLQC